LIGLGFLAPVLAVVSVVTTRWRYRVNAVALILVGTVIAVGAYPYRDPSPLGRVFKSVATSSTVGLALRSTARVVPLVCLGIALAVGAGLAALGARFPRRGWLAAFAVISLALLANPPLWSGGFVGKNLRRPEDVPASSRDAAAALDQSGSATRVLEIPGSDFAAYRWGNTVDPVTPGLMDRPVVARELIPFGSAPSADLLIAFDRRLQEGVLDPASVVPVARLMGVGDLLVRSDLEYERYRVTRPKQVWRLLSAVPAGLLAGRGFGDPLANEASPALPMHDEIYLGTKDVTDPSPVVDIPIKDPLPIVRARSASTATILAGDGEGMVEAGAAGLLDGDGVLLYSAALAARSDVWRQVFDNGASLVLTDTNRKRAMRWGTVRDNDGYTERADEKPLRVDPSDNRLPVFPDAGIDAYTTVEQRGVARVEATGYGNPVTYTPGDRPSQVLDGDPSTAWTVGALGPVGGQRLLIEANAPVTTDHLDVQQAFLGARVITQLGVLLDGRELESVDLTERSFEPGGQRIELGGSRTFTTLELVIEGDNVGRQPRYDDQNGVGLAEVGVGGLRVDEVVRLPTDLLAAAGTSSLHHDLTILLARLRADPSEPFARDQETTMARAFTLPTARTFRISGQARLDATLADDRLDAILGTRVLGVQAARSSGRLPGVLGARASSATDGDVTTAWTNHFGAQEGSWLEVQLDAPRTLNRLDLVVVADGDHSVPTRLRVIADGGTEQRVVVPPVAAGAAGVVHLPITLEPIRGTTFRVVIDAVQAVTTIDWFGDGPIDMPVSIAEIGFGTATALPIPGAPASVPDTCRSDLLSVDGRAVWLRITGSTSSATHLDGLAVSTCGPDVGGFPLSAGDHEVRTAPGSATGFDLDRLIFGSSAGGGVAPLLPTAPAGPQASSNHRVEVLAQGRTSFDLRVTGAPGPVWLVLGQSWSRGWKATAEGNTLGPPVIVDGYANGWLVDPGPNGVIDVNLRWTPQRLVMAGFGLSAAGVILCLALAVLPIRRRRPVGAHAVDPMLRLRLLRSGQPVPWPAALAASVVTGAVSGAAIHPAVGAAVTVVALVSLRLPVGRAIPALGAVAGVATAGAFTVAKQLRNDYPADFGWTDFFRPAHLLASCGLALLALLLVVDRLRGEAAERTIAAPGDRPSDVEAPTER
jgi:hypothetical protein